MYDINTEIFSKKNPKYFGRFRGEGILRQRYREPDGEG